MRLIDADNVRGLFDAEFKETRKLILAGETHLDNLAEGFTEADRVIREMPTVDAEVVVRCKDCKYFKNYGKTSLLIDGKNIKAGWCHRRARYDEEYRMPPDGFCSYCERKDGAENG